VTETKPVGTVVFERTVRVREYESAKASVFIQFNLDGSGDAIMAAVGEAFFQAKAAVYDELGLEFSVDAGGVIREALNATFGQVTDVTPTVHVARTQAAVAPAPAPALAPVAAAPAAPAAVVDASRPPYDPATDVKGEKAANGKWAKARLYSHPDEFWDNAAAKAEGRFSPRSPDFKHKDTGLAVWND
jgi:hypothetical protein